MDNSYFTLITVTVSGLFGLAVAIATSVLNKRSQKKVYKRDIWDKRIESLRTLYVDSLSKLDVLWHEEGKVDDSQLVSYMTMKSKIELMASKKVQQLYFLAADNLDKRNYLLGRAYKDLGGGKTMISQDSSKLKKDSEKHQEEFIKAIAELKESMRADLEQLEKLRNKEI